MEVPAVLLLLLALLGHAALWVAIVNRVHAIGLGQRIVSVITWFCFFWLAFVPLALAGWCVVKGEWPSYPASAGPWEADWLPLLAYLALCWLSAAVTVPCWMRRHLFHRPSHVVRSRRTLTLLDGRASSAARAANGPIRHPLAPLAAEEHPHGFLVRLPGNESLRLDLTELSIDVPRLPRDLDGLSVVHLSDFHFTGRVSKAYFEEVVRLSNALEPDLVAVTGDLVDRGPYIDWLPDTLGRLTARYGVYFVLGNHDRRVDIPRMLTVLADHGLVHLGSRWIEAAIRGRRVVLAGNELPWLGSAPDLSDCPPRPSAPLRLLLAHTPDQFAWARQWDADLLLAGHTHGGQIRLPWIGPIFAPSRAGVAYASGLFYDPPTIMEVTRGVSGELPLRWNCAPEIVRLVLHAKNADLSCG